MPKILTAALSIILTALILTGCGGNDQPQPEVTDVMPGTQPAPRRQPVNATAPVADARMIIAGMQNDLVPFEKPLTEEQQLKINEVFNPDDPMDMRDVFGVLTVEQKDVLVSKIRTWLAESEHPFTDEQVERYMAIGPGSADKAPTEIMTQDQIQTIMQAARESIQKQRQQQMQMQQRQQQQ